MTKQQVEQKIKEILAKDTRYKHLNIKINFSDNKHTKLINITNDN